MVPLPTPYVYSSGRDYHLLTQFAQIHHDCVMIDHQLLTFLPSVETGVLDKEKLQHHWIEQDALVRKGLKDIIVQISDDAGQEVVAGVVVLSRPFSETGPFRGLVEKLMVSPAHRRKGVARQLMSKLEEVALTQNRSLLILDTTIGTDAEHVYSRLGYTEFGVLPRYGISPKDGSLVDERFFYKDLRK